MKALRKFIAIFLSLLLSFSYAAIIASGIAEEAEIINNEMDVLEALGFDSSVMPEGFDEASTENPYGTNNVSLEVIPELFLRYRDGLSLYATGYGQDKAFPSAVPGFFTDEAFAYRMAYLDSSESNNKTYSSNAEADFTGSGKKAQVVSAEITKNPTDKNSVANKITIRFAEGIYSYASLSISANIAASQSYNRAFEGRDFTAITAGDYDGDGYDEFAVYIAEDGNPRIHVYKLTRTLGSIGETWKNASSWKLIWVHQLNTASCEVSRGVSGTAISSDKKTFANACPSNVSLASTDVDNDGVDDLVFSASFSSYKLKSLDLFSDAILDATFPAYVKYSNASKVGAT